MKSGKTIRQLSKAPTTTGLMQKFTVRFGIDKQLELKRRIEHQEWVGICDVNFTKFGKGLVSTQEIQKDDIIVDYHGKIVSGISVNDYVTDESVQDEYVLQVKYVFQHIFKIFQLLLRSRGYGL